jgi:hypothetical protein
LLFTNAKCPSGVLSGGDEGDEGDERVNKTLNS